MEPNGSGLWISSRVECLALVRSTRLGRVVFTRRALPAIEPVNFVLDADDDVLVFTSQASDLATALPGAIVAFEADGFDASGSGWAVTITGRAGAATAPLEGATAPPPWSRGPGARFIRIRNQVMTGLRSPSLVSARDDRATGREPPAVTSRTHHSAADETPCE